MVKLKTLTKESREKIRNQKYKDRIQKHHIQKLKLKD
jgi:hypothetical protein